MKKKISIFPLFLFFIILLIFFYLLIIERNPNEVPSALPRIMVDEPTVDIDCAFLLGAITIIGISAANKF